MIKTPNLDLPIYDKPDTDTFKVADWNKANENIDYVFGEFKNNPNVNAIDIKAREDIINNHREVTEQLDNIASNEAEFVYKFPHGLDKNGNPIDDSDSLQEYINYVMSKKNHEKEGIILPKGIIYISKPINVAKNGFYPKFVGSGIAKTIIVATQPMEQMFTFGTSTGQHSRILIENITFDGGYVANCCIDGQGMRYSTIQNCEFVNVKEGGVAVKWGQWCNRFINNVLRLSSNAQSGEVGYNVGIANGIEVTGTQNNFIISKNTFSSCLHGVILNGCHDTHITQNTFDLCKLSAVYVINKTLNLNISENYIEACGTEKIKVDLPTVVGTGTEEIQGAIIIKSASTQINDSHENVVIEKNEFANCGKTSILAISHIKNLKFCKNDIMKNYSYDSLVTLFGVGCLYTYKGKSLIELNSTDNFTKVINNISTTKFDTSYGLFVRINGVTNNSKDLLNNVTSTITDGNTLTKTQYNKTFKSDVSIVNNSTCSLVYILNFDKNYFKNTILHLKGDIFSANVETMVRVISYSGGSEVSRRQYSNTSLNEWKSFTLSGIEINEVDKITISIFNTTKGLNCSFSVKNLELCNDF